MELEELEAIATNEVPGRPNEIRYVDLGGRLTASSTPAQEKTLVSRKVGKQRQRVRLPAAVAHSPSLSPPMKSSGLPLEKVDPRKQIERSREHPPDTENGHLMPAEMKNFNPDSIESFLGNASLSEDESDGKEEELKLGETPFLQAKTSDQIIVIWLLVVSGKGVKGCSELMILDTGNEDDRDKLVLNRTVPATIKFALPKAPPSPGGSFESRRSVCSWHT